MSDGSTVPVPRGGVVAFVGPNNAGKSLSLREIHAHLVQQQMPPRAVRSVSVSKEGAAEELVEWLDEHCHKTWSGGQEVYSRAGGGSVVQSNAISWWVNGPPFVQLGSFFVFLATGEGRLQAAHGANNVDLLTQPPQHPLHSLYMDSSLEEKISRISTRAFRKPLVLNRHAGNMVYLHVGEAPPAGHGAGAPPLDYLQALSRLPRLDEQGDGMKSFIGLLLNLTASSYPFVLVDEPEAFLHPPQARLIGKMLGDEKEPDSQIFVATHDSDVLRGLLDSSARDLTVVRLVRDGNVNNTSQVEPEKVRELWKDPLLRYSNVLDGLFHDAVVLCEGDADCRYYQSVLDAMQAEEVEEEEVEVRVPDLLFTHCGGKDRMPTVIEALQAVNVPIRVVADFDVLREENPLRRIVEGLNGDWASVEGDWSVVTSALGSDTRAPSTGYVREQLDELFNGIGTATLHKEDAQKVRQLTRTESGWDKAKRSGRSAVPSGEATVRLERLLATLRGMGLFVVEVGELERFAPQVPGHGPAWVSAVHEQGLHADGSLTEARTFTKDVVGSL